MKHGPHVIFKSKSVNLRQANARFFQKKFLMKFQIAPLSHRWKAAIEKRIQEVSQITLVAVLRGARLHPGQYWNLSGTFLFTIYVMTALGTGYLFVLITDLL